MGVGRRHACLDLRTLFHGGAFAKPRTLAALILAGVALASAAPQAGSQGSGSATERRDALQDRLTRKKTQAEFDKLNEEIRKLRDENNRAWWEKGSVWTAVGGAVAALAALGTLLGLVLTQRNHGQQRIDLAKSEARRRSDEHFAALSAALASESPAERVSAVAGIESFMRAGDRTYHLQLVDLLRGILTIERSHTSDRVIARTFVKLLKQCIGEVRQHDQAAVSTGTVDLQDVWIPDVDASGIDLSGIQASGACMDRSNIEGTCFDNATLAGAQLNGVIGDAKTSFRGAVLAHVKLRSASLAGADFRGVRLTPPRRSALARAPRNAAKADLELADLRGADLEAARLEGARLVSVDFRRANLRGANLKAAELQQADFRKADLTGNTRFDNANVANADFRGATLDDTARHSLLKTNWEQARVDGGLRHWLEQHA